MFAKRPILTIVVASAMMLVIAAVLLAVRTAQAQPAAQSPELEGTTIPYTGRLSDDTGALVADGTYSFAFALYGAETGGEVLWAETQEWVDVRGGNFGALLGSVNRVPQAIAESAELWLAVEVRGPGERDYTALAPRQRLSSISSESPDALSCDHTHLYEWWEGSSSSYGLVVDNRNGTGDGIRGYSNASAANYAGVYGVNFNTGPGVYGRSDGGGPGVAGYSSGRGVYGSGTDGVVGESGTDYMSGVYGFNTVTGYGVTGRAEGYFGVLAWGDDSSAYDAEGDLLLAGNYGEIFAAGDLLDLYSNGYVVVDLDNNNNSSSCFNVLSGTDGVLWGVCETAGGTVTAGSQASIASTAENGQRLLYAVEGAGVWVEDVGTASLVDGEATVAFEPVFAQTVNLEHSYQVFVTPISDEPVWLYVTAKTADGFTVRGVTLDGQPASCTFDYRVVAERLGYEGVRLTSYVPEVGK
ncbi:MAG: hypothetical protein JW900_07685 [Anaerolineae bacterium]|nr:hypothetical protein [Anaerolineae bacterium]